MTTVLYPGTFDPVTNGHLDIIRRIATSFDKAVVAVAKITTKNNAAYSLEQRLQWMQTAVTANGHHNVSVRVLDGLTVDVARQEGASIIIRGIRAVSDFEYEFQMAQMNRHLCADVDTLFLMTSPEYLYVSSSLVKSVATIDPYRIRDLVPACVYAEAFTKK